jgi:hypothetical protein
MSIDGGFWLGLEKRNPWTSTCGCHCLEYTQFCIHLLQENWSVFLKLSLTNSTLKMIFEVTLLSVFSKSFIKGKHNCLLLICIEAEMTERHGQILSTVKSDYTYLLHKFKFSMLRLRTLFWNSLTLPDT